MSRPLKIYLFILIGVVMGWLYFRSGTIRAALGDLKTGSLLLIIALYMLSHVFRMIRLALLTLHDKDKALPLVMAHTLTAFPSSFMPFKIGEMLRLGAFFHVFDYKKKALAIWLTERFGDILVISLFILSLYLFDIDVPPAMRFIFIIFVSFSVLGLLTFFAVAKMFVFLNRYLVLSSHSKRGLFILKTSSALRQLEAGIYTALEGRFIGFILLSVIVWAFELLALSAFFKFSIRSVQDFSQFFVAALSGSLPGGPVAVDKAFGLYQSVALVALTLFFGLLLLVGTQLNKSTRT